MNAARWLWKSAGMAAALARVLLTVGAFFGIFRLALHETLADETQRRVVLASDLLLSMVAAWLALTACACLRQAAVEREGGPVDETSIRRRVRSFAALFVIFAAPMLIWYAGEYPGHMMSDQVFMFLAASKREAAPFLSTAYSLWAVGVLRLFHDFTAIALVNIALISWILADVFSLMLRLGLARVWAAPFIALIALSIPVGLSSINVSHDILTAFLLLGVAAMLLRIMAAGVLDGERRPPLRGLATIVLMCTAIACMRGEGIALVIAVPLALLLTRRVRPLTAGVMAVAIFACVFAFRGPIEPRLWTPEVRASDFRNRYKITLMINPLSYMRANHYFSTTPEEDKAAISDSIGWDRFVSDYNPLNIANFWGNIPNRVDEPRIAALRRVYVRSALDNPGLFLSNRVAVFCGCLGVNPVSMYPFMWHREQIDAPTLYRGYEKELRAGGLAPSEAPRGLARLTRPLRDWSYPDRASRSPGYLIWNIWPALALLLVTLASWRRCPRAAAIALVFAAPVALIFLGAPEAHFKYLTALYFFGFLAIPLMAFDRVLGRRAPRLP